MRRITIIIFCLVTFLSTTNSQVFNTATTLKKGGFAIGIEPAFIMDGDEFFLFLHGGYGIKKGLDMSLKFGLGGGDTYVGGDLEFALRKNISLAVGAHSWNVFGLDGTLLFNIPIKSDIKLVTGLDMNVDFPDDDVNLPLWIPIGLEVGLSGRAKLMFEVEIAITQDASHMFGGGVNFFF